MATGTTRRQKVRRTLLLVADPAACNSCGRCTSECPMSIDLQKMVADAQYSLSAGK